MARMNQVKMMVEKSKQKLTLDRPSIYQIKVPGVIDVSQSGWVGTMAISVESDANGTPITTLAGEIDQAALHGLLRRLYSLGLPLISVHWVKDGLAGIKEPN
jgi:hypothetical protein